MLSSVKESYWNLCRKTWLALPSSEWRTWVYDGRGVVLPYSADAIPNGHSFLRAMQQGRPEGRSEMRFQWRVLLALKARELWALTHQPVAVKWHGQG